MEEPEHKTQQEVVAGDAGRSAPQVNQERRQRKKPRWGAETEAGLKVLETVQAPPTLPGRSSGGGGGDPGCSGTAAAAAAAAASATPGPRQPAAGTAAPDAAAPPKRRRSRWEEAPAAAVPAAAAPPLFPPALAGHQIVLPDAIVALVNAHSDPKVVALQGQLKMVRI
jgi:hypothetical protein